ncbi:MAG: rod shape-determining protein MreC [Nitrospirae bacterium]|nr:rod shape-determining protein MreC [Nitrospirota bacterium]
MLSFLVRHKNPVLFGLAVVSILLVLSAQAGGRHAFETIRRGAAVLLVPLEQGGSVLWRAAAGRVEEVRELAGARRENDRLRLEVRRLEAELAKAGESEREAERLAALVQLARQTSVPTVPARVVARHPTNWFNAVTIDRGETQGVEREAALLVPSGVVGRVVSVRAGSADALLITDPRSAVAVRNARTRDEAIMEGRGRGRCRLAYVGQGQEVREGDLMVTSGMDEIFPPGLPAGKVVRVSGKGVGLFQEVEVEPVARLQALDEVAATKREAGGKKQGEKKP